MPRSGKTGGVQARKATPETGRYLYAVCRGVDTESLRTVRGIEDQPLEVVEHLDLVALVSTVPLSSFGEEALRSNLEDLAWLETAVRSHDAVVHAASALAPTAPMRLATICFDDHAVRARLREWYISLTHVLDRVEGCSEWSVKVLSPPAASSSPTVDARPSSGAEYLRRKKAAAAERADTTESAVASAGLIYEQLSGRARASRQLPHQDPRLSGHEGTMVLNAAFLVSDAEARSFADLIGLLADEHLGLLVDGRGPWPPYSFAMLG